MKHFLLTYTLAPDYLARRPDFRAEHLALAQAAAERGELLLGGAVAGLNADPPEEAQLLFAGADTRAVEAFARADPYLTNSLVTGWRVREWLTVVGQGAANPL
ncbi:MAG: YciI-like protein [Croceibacterium sp.]